MANTLYKAEFEDKLPLGGIGTGHIDIGHDARFYCDFAPVFAIKAEKDGELYDARVLQSTQIEDLSLPCFENSRALSFFPFAEVTLTDSSFPASVKLTAFSPFFPLNDTDSGIPAVMLEFDVTNTSCERFYYSVCGVLKNNNSFPFNRMGCTDTGEAYVFLKDNVDLLQNVCIATDGKNVSFCEYVASYDDFTHNFKGNPTLENSPVISKTSHGASGALCTHFSVDAGKTCKVYFCISQYKSENGFSRNYYAQYFESSLECVSYTFRQRERLLDSSMELCENILGASLCPELLHDINKDLFTFSGKDLIRLDDGRLISYPDREFSDFHSFINRSGILETLFPSLDYTRILHFYKDGLYNDADDKTLMLCILESYRRYILCGDTDALIEEWYYIVKCLEKLFCQDEKESARQASALSYAVIEAAVYLSDAVRDKKRHELYSSMLKNTPYKPDYIASPVGFARINEASGFEYSAVGGHIGFRPDYSLCPHDTFRCFFCTPQGYGYVEEGIDYIEINLLKGALNIRSFGVPRTPRLVQYGGRNWRFTDTGNCALLDSELEITPRKKLTIFIDIKQ